MKEKPTRMPLKEGSVLYDRIRQILESARTNVARSVNTTQVVANWLIGREIVEEEQKGKKRAGYGEELLKDLSARLTKDYGKGWLVRNLEYCRKFYIEYPFLLKDQKSNAVRSISSKPPTMEDRQISNAASSKSETEPATGNIRYAPRSDSWQPGQLHPNLSWTHYRTLLRVDKAEKIFASRYKLHLPTEAELKAELRRELRQLGKFPESGNNPN